MREKRRFHIRKPEIRLFDTTGLSNDVQRSLYLAIVAVTFSMVFSNVTSGAAWTGYQRMLGADSMMLGIISAIPVTASTLQILASYILERWQARRKLFLVFGLISRLLWCGIGLIPVIIPSQVEHLRIYALMVMLGLSAGAGAFINVSFYSLMGDLVPMRIRGRYFSARQAVSLLAGILTGLFVSFVMDRVSGYIGYTMVLVVAGLFGAMDICCFFWVKWPPMQPHEGKREGLITMLRHVFADKGYMRIVRYFTCWFFAVNISGPFTNVYFLEQVRMTYTEITLITQILQNIVTVLVISWWGRKMDRYGNQPIVQLAGLYCMIMPLTYLFTGPRSFLVLPFTYIFSGMAWPASDLGQQNMYLAKAPVHNRSMYVAVFFASTQLLGTALSNYVGGFLMNGPLWTLQDLGLRFVGFDLTRYDYIFMLSSFLRMICVLLLLPRLRDESETPASTMVRDMLGHASSKLHFILHGLRATWMRRQYRKQRGGFTAPKDEDETSDEKEDHNEQ
ncbi:MFS transporter [Eubacteriales bacterium OttesenSCG-928-A19]|nr:MFS transporter [Eubacteriales bacterium OttesenSCG-928-A19]